MMKNHSPREGIVRLRIAGSKAGYSGQLTVPAHMARMIGMGTYFRAEIVEEGVLFRYICAADEDPFAMETNASWIKR